MYWAGSSRTSMPRPFSQRAQWWAEPQASMMTRRHIAVGKPAFELGAGQALGFNHAPVFIGHGELKHRLCKIDGNSSSIHVGLLCLRT